MYGRKCFIGVAAIIAVLMSTSFVWAIDCSWISTAASGDWNDSDNWQDGYIANGSEDNAFFDLDIPDGGITVNVDIEGGPTILALYVSEREYATGGNLTFQGNTINMAGTSADLNISSLAPGYTTVINAPISVAAGINLTKKNAGALSLGGAVTVNDGNTTIADGSTVTVTGTLSTLYAVPWDPSAPPATGQTFINGGSTISLSGSTAQLSSGYDTSIGMDGSSGTLNVGLTSTDSATVTLGSGLWVGGGVVGSTNTGTVNIHGNSTLTASGGWNKIEIGSWGSSAGVLNVYDSGRLNGAEIRIGANSDPTIAGAGGTINLNNQSQLNATGNVYVGANGNGALNINDDSTATITGALVTSAWAGNWVEVIVDPPGENYWQPNNGNTGVITIGGSDRLALQAGSIKTGDGRSIWPINGTCIGTITFTGSARIQTTGDCIIGEGSKFVGTLILNTSAKANFGGQLIIGQYDASEGYVNVSGNAELIAAGIQVSGGAADWYTGWQTRQLNVSGDAVVSSTGDTSVGNASATGGFITVKENGQLKVGGNLIMGVTGPAWQNSITNTSSKATLVTGDLNLNAGSISVPGVTNDGTGAAGGLDVLGTVILNGGWLVATAPNSDFIKPSILVQVGGAKIDPNWNNLTITQALAEDSASTGGGLELGKGNLKLSGALTYTGETLIDDEWSTLEIDSPGTTNLAAISGAGILKIGDGAVANTVNVDSVSVGTLTITAGSKLAIKPLFGGITAGGGMKAVPEPGTLVLLAMGALALAGIAWKRK
jgi:hypothetical protein